LPHHPPGDFGNNRMMGIGSRRLQRAVAWMGLVAVLLLALVPTVSRIASAHPADGHAAHAAHAHHHAGAGAHEPTLPGEDCWSKCSYCDFLPHSPPIANVVHVAPIAVSPAAPAPATLVALRSRTPFTAALPRGPPSFLA
jgi:hypothetical protein